MQISLGFLAPSAPSFTPPPQPPPAAAPATLASSSVRATGSNQKAMQGAALADFGTAGGAQGVAPGSVTTAKNNLLGGTQ